MTQEVAGVSGSTVIRSSDVADIKFNDLYVKKKMTHHSNR
jgi:hypothetical protein